MRARSVVATLLVAATLTLVGHSTVRALRAQVVQPPPLPPSRNTTEPDRRWLGAETCQASAPRELGRSSVRNLRLHVASQPAGPRTAGSYAHHADTLAAWSTSEHAFTTRAIGAELGAPHEVALDQGINLSVLAPASGGRFLAITTGFLCGGEVRGAACVRAVGLGSDGRTAGPAYAPPPQDQETQIVSSAVLHDASGTPTGVAVAFRSRWSFHDIVLFRVDAAGAVVADAHPIHVESSGAAPITRIVADGERVVAYGHDSVWSDARGRETRLPYLIALGGRRQSFPSFVPATATLAYMRARGTTVDLVFRVPRLAPRWARVSSADGSQIAPVATLTAGAPTLEGPVLPSLRVLRGQLVLERRDVREQPVGEATPIGAARGRIVSAWSWEGESLHVVWGVRTGREWVVSESHVACPEISSAP